MTVWNDDDRAFFDRALLLMAQLVYEKEKTGTIDFLMRHATWAAEELTNERKARLETYTGNIGKQAENA